MKVYKLEIMVIDHDEVGIDEVKQMIEDARYPNHSISPIVMNTQSVDIGEWNDENPLNKHLTMKAEYNRLFSK